jgi:uncharacterized lipoprotein YajG
MKPLLLIALAAAILGGCAKQPTVQTTMYNDWRTGTDYTPYRSIPSVLYCDDCRF